MASAALEKRDEEIEKLKGRVSSIRRAAEREANKIQSLAVKSVVSFAFGRYQRNETQAGRALPTAMGLEPELLYGALLYGAARFSDGRTAEVLEDASEPFLMIYAYKKGQAPG